MAVTDDQPVSVGNLNAVLGGVLALIDTLTAAVGDMNDRVTALEKAEPQELWNGDSGSVTVTASTSAVSKFAVTLSTGKSVDIPPTEGTYSAGSSGGGPVQVGLTVSGSRCTFSVSSYTGSVTLKKIVAYMK